MTASRTGPGRAGPGRAGPGRVPIQHGRVVKGSGAGVGGGAAPALCGGDEAVGGGELLVSEMKNCGINENMRFYENLRRVWLGGAERRRRRAAADDLSLWPGSL